MSNLIRRGIKKAKSDSVKNFILILLKQIWGSLRIYNVIIRVINNSHTYDAYANPTKIIWISPKRIITHSMNFTWWQSTGSIRDGNWDVRLSTFESHYKYKSIEKRFVNGLCWENTEIYAKINQEIKKKGTFDGCNDITDVKRRYNTDIENLYSNIKSNGYDFNRYISNPKWYNPFELQSINHPEVWISRNGEFILRPGGFHRVSICKLLNIKIPVWVSLRHKKWQNVREEYLNANNFDDLSDDAKRFVDHPDLQDIPLDKD